MKCGLDAYHSSSQLALVLSIDHLSFSVELLLYGTLTLGHLSVFILSHLSVYYCKVQTLQYSAYGAQHRVYMFTLQSTMVAFAVACLQYRAAEVAPCLFFPPGLIFREVFREIFRVVCQAWICSLKILLVLEV